MIYLNFFAPSIGCCQLIFMEFISANQCRQGGISENKYGASVNKPIAIIIFTHFIRDLLKCHLFTCDVITVHIFFRCDFSRVLVNNIIYRYGSGLFQLLPRFFSCNSFKSVVENKLKTKQQLKIIKKFCNRPMRHYTCILEYIPRRGQCIAKYKVFVQRFIPDCKIT